MTLAELILAFGLLVPIIVVVVGLFPYSHVVARRASDVQTGFDLACNQVERLRAGDFDTIVSSTSTVQGAHGVIYTVEVDIQPAIPGQKTVTLKKVAVVVRWIARQAERVQLDTVVARMAP